MMTLLRCVLLALFLAATVELGAAWRPRSTVATSPLESAYASEKRAHARNRRRALFTSAHSDGADKQRKAVIVSAAGAASADTPSPRVSSPFWKGMMMGICLIWASNFAVIKRSFVGIPASVLTPQLFLAIRFTLASLATLPLLIGSNLSWGMVRNGILVGLSIFFGYIGQSMGILTSTANKAAFFCSLNVVWVALVNGLRYKRFSPKTWLAILLAITGAGVIELKGFVLPEVQDLWLLLQPIGFGTGYLLLEENMKQYPDSAKAVTAIKLITVAVCTVIWAALRGHTLASLQPILAHPAAVGGILYTGLITTALAILLQSIVFRRITSTDASIILTTEPIWAAGIAIFLIGEVITRQDCAGGSLIILGCLVNEIDVFAKAKQLFIRREQKPQLQAAAQK